MASARNATPGTTQRRRLGSLALSFAVASALLGAASPARAQQPSCLPDEGRVVYLCDPLVAGSQPRTVAEQHGGRFVPEGWQVVGFESYLRYDLGQPVDSGLLSFWVRNVTPEGMLPSHLPDVSQKFVIARLQDQQQDDRYFATIRTWGPWSDIYGWLKIKAGSRIEGECLAEPFRHAADWQAQHWYHVELEYGEGHMELRLDGRVIGAFEYPCPWAVRHLYVPHLPELRGWLDSVHDVIYSHVSFAGGAIQLDPEPDPPRAWIDEPAEGETVSGPTRVAGWATDASGIASVRLLLDGEDLALPDLRYGGARPDVCADHAALDDPGCPNVGWHATLETRAHGDGPHVVRVVVRDPHDNETTVERVFTIHNDGPPPEDLGPPRQDLGPPMRDSGPPPRDAGPPADDAGPADEDAGGRDSGDPMPDGGNADAGGRPTDGGTADDVGGDASPVRDAQTTPGADSDFDGQQPGDSLSGSGCRVAAGRPRSRVVADALRALLRARRAERRGR